MERTCESCVLFKPCDYEIGPEPKAYVKFLGIKWPVNHFRYMMQCAYRDLVIERNKSFGWCKRYPEIELKKRLDWCGEHKGIDNAK